MAMAIERDEEGKRCPVCGNWFYRKTEFCSDDCFAKYQSRKKVCSVCGREFYAKYASAVYCSDICRAQKNRAYCAKQKERRTETRRTFLAVLALILEKKEQAGQKGKPKRRRVVHEERVCPVCGKSFIPVRSTKICCSYECAQKNFRAKSRKIIKKVCLQCGKEFETTNSIKVYCSEDCYKRKFHKVKKQNDSREKVLHILKQYKKECPVCGIRFYSTGNNTFCSSKCENMDW